MVFSNPRASGMGPRTRPYRHPHRCREAIGGEIVHGLRSWRDKAEWAVRDLGICGIHGVKWAVDVVRSLGIVLPKSISSIILVVD